MSMMEANAQSVLRRVSDWVLAHPAHDPGSVRMKADGSRVTDADLALHEGISALLVAHLPNCFVLSEEMEGPREPPERGWVAVLDPLDGTENFIDGRVEWSVCLSLWHDGVHAASGLILPSIGARLISGDPVARFNSDTVVISAGMVGKALPQKFRGARVTGSAGWNCYHVIRGSFAAFMSPPNLRCWDIQAGACLALQAGCSVRLNGAAYDMSPLGCEQRYSVDIART